MLCKSYSVPWKNTEGFFFYNPLHMKKEKPHELSLEDYLLFLYMLDFLWSLTRILREKGNIGSL